MRADDARDDLDDKILVTVQVIGARLPLRSVFCGEAGAQPHSACVRLARQAAQFGAAVATIRD